MGFFQWLKGKKNPAGQEKAALPELYGEQEINLLEAYIVEQFGEFESVFHEIVSPDIHVDIAIIPPNEQRNYYTLVTMGMGAHHMNVPAEWADCRLERAEIVACLPADWELQNNDEKWYWPLRWMKILARLPIEQDTGIWPYCAKQRTVCRQYQAVRRVAVKCALWAGGKTFGIA